MTKHKDIAKVSFTGSTATGKKVMESVSSSLKRLTLKRVAGGNDAAMRARRRGRQGGTPNDLRRGDVQRRPDLSGDQTRLRRLEHL